jgi:hypothetical protein
MKKWNSDLARVRELQQQLAVLRGIQSARLAARNIVEEAAASAPALTAESEDTEKPDEFKRKPRGELMQF